MIDGYIFSGLGVNCYMNLSSFSFPNQFSFSNTVFFFFFFSFFFISCVIVKFTQLCSKFPPTALLNFACDWLALDRDLSFGQLTSPIVTLYPCRELNITSKVQECCGQEFVAKLGENDYSE